VLQIDIQQSPIDVLSVATAQRYSVLVKARNDASHNWLVHANMMTSMFAEVPSSLNPSSYFIAKFRGTPF
jgi:iron transport multicopper oxidase